MKKLSLFLAIILSLCACTSMSSFDGNSTKPWISIESSKQDLEGKTIDVCYKLDVRFSPPEATQRFDTDKACMTKCCWYSETKQITLNLNFDFGQELEEKGQANKYDLDTLVFNVRYSNLLDTIHASVRPSSVLRRDGLITLDYTTVKNDKGLLNIDLGDLKVKDYSEEEDDGHKGSYLYKDQEKAMAEYQENLSHLREMQEYQKVDTGLTPGEKAPTPKTQNSVEPQKEIIPSTQKTVIGKLQTQEDRAKVAQESFKEDISSTQEEQANFTQKTVYITETYDLNDINQRKALLEKKLAYERAQAVALLKQFYEKDIDEYIRSIDKEQAAKGLVLLANDREWKTTKIGYPIYNVKCSVKGKLGKTQSSMKEYLIPCGIYEVQLDDKTVLPRDITAITIVNKDYKY